MSMSRRDLTPGETRILRMLQGGYGPQNSVDEVFFTDAGEAGVLVRASDGTSPLMVNLTSLAAWREDGSIQSDEELKRDWLHLK